MSGKNYHLCISVRGALNRPYRYRDLKGMFRHDDDRLMTGREVQQVLIDELAKGHEVIPAGECDNFDYKVGCKGHESDKR